MATIKALTDVQQSKKLAEILPLESADYCYIKTGVTKDNWMGIPEYQFNAFPHKDYSGESIGCWYLAALLEQFPYGLCDNDGVSWYLQMNKEDDVYQLIYTDTYGDYESIETDSYDHFVDACYEMILKLNKLKML